MQQYKYNGKEFDNMHGLNTYDYGARQYNPVTARWDRIDPLCEKYYSTSPYVYCVNNPVMLVDPDGRACTDYVDCNSGEITTINDGKDNVIAAVSFEIEYMTDLYNDNRSEYQAELASLENTSANLNMTSQQFDTFAGAVYAESAGGFNESLGIVNVLENRANNQGNSLENQLSTKSPYGIYGLKDKGKRYHNEKGKKASIKRANVHRAIAVGLTTDTDITNGAYFWDGTDIKFNSHYTQWGVTFSQQSHNLWNQKNTYGTAQLVTTAAHGKTIFTKLKNQGKKWYMQK